MSNWHSIWAQRILRQQAGCSLLRALINADGFDSGAGDYTEAQWLSMSTDLAARLQLNRLHTILEVGCGAGALLYALRMHTGCDVAGIDYSEQLVNAARMAMPGSCFEFGSADALPFEAASFDAVVAHSVFHYFPDASYARIVIGEMMRVLRPGGRICVLDINDIASRHGYEARRRAWSRTPVEYDRKYAGLDHLFLSRDEVISWLEAEGALQVHCFPHAVPEYLNSQFRFNVIGSKPG